MTSDVVVEGGTHTYGVTVNVDFDRGVVHCLPCGVAVDVSCALSESFSQSANASRASCGIIGVTDVAEAVCVCGLCDVSGLRGGVVVS